MGVFHSCPANYPRAQQKSETKLIEQEGDCRGNTDRHWLQKVLYRKDS